MFEKLPYSDEYEKKLEEYSDRLYDSLRKHGFPEKDLWMTFCYSPEEFQREFGEKYNLESLEGFDYVLSADRSGYIIEYVRFNTEEEFERGCRTLADAFRVRDDEPETGVGESDEDKFERDLTAITDKAIKNFGDKVRAEMGRTWEHASKDDPGKSEPKPIRFRDELLDEFDADEITCVASLLVKKIMETGSLSEKEVFRSNDGKVIVCEDDGNAWTLKSERAEAEPDKGA